MSITIKTNQDNTGIQMSGTTAGRNKTQDTKTRSTVFAGDLMLGQGNQIEQKKQTARRQAMKLITDAWGRDELASQSIKDMEQQKADYVEQMQEAKEHEKTFEKSKKELQEQYGVADDSQEQKDLELLEKFQNYKNGSHDESFTKEDVDRLKELQNLPRTEYQEKALRLNQIAGSMKVTASNANDKLIELTDTIAKAKTDQAKSQDMLKAGSAADDILEASNKEIMGLLIQDGKEHIDKEQEEAQKKAEEQKEKRDEQQERISQNLVRGFAFLEESYGTGAELTLFAANLTRNDRIRKFLGSYGCPAYTEYEQQLIGGEEVLKNRCRDIAENPKNR